MCIFQQASVTGPSQPQPQPLVDAVNAVLLNGETQVGYSDRMQTNTNVSPSTHWSMSSGHPAPQQQQPVPQPQPQQPSPQMLPSMVAPSVSLGMCMPQGTTVLPAQIPMQSSGGPPVSRHSLEHTYQRHSPYPQVIRSGAQPHSVIPHHGSPRMVALFQCDYFF